VASRPATAAVATATATATAGGEKAGCRQHEKSGLQVLHCEHLKV
jgi:hypothetical protein